LPSARLSDLGGVEACIEEVLELIAMPLAHPEIYLHTGVQPPRFGKSLFKSVVLSFY
jgi:ribosome biogenesis ATPase